MRRNLLLLAALLCLSAVTNLIAWKFDGNVWQQVFGLGGSSPPGPVQAGPAPGAMPGGQPPQLPASTTRPRAHRGMTWGVAGEAGKRPGDPSSVSCAGLPATADAAPRCNAYLGDTPCEQSLPMLCLSPERLAEPAPAGGTSRDYYNGWSGARLALSRPIRGTELSSPVAGDERCAAELGKGWRMAEFHDGGGGWGLRGRGAIAPTSRFWVRINDQPANCWDAASR